MNAFRYLVIHARNDSVVAVTKNLYNAEKIAERLEKQTGDLHLILELADGTVFTKDNSWKASPDALSWWQQHWGEAVENGLLVVDVD